MCQMQLPLFFLPSFLPFVVTAQTFRPGFKGENRQEGRVGDGKEKQDRK
jgi:hypothetical protein